MKPDLSFQKNQLLLNPRLPREQRLIFEEAWNSLVEPTFHHHVGIATSGSTGSSIGKLILLSREALEASAQAVNERFQSGRQDIWLKSLPNFHVGGLGILIRARLSGAKVHEARLEKWEPVGFVQQVKESKATLISLVPTQVFDLVQRNLRAPESVRAVIVGGGRFESSLREKANALGWPCLASYGMTETCSQIATALTPQDPSLILLSHVTVKTVESGFLAIRATSLLSAQIIFSDRGAELVDPKQGEWFISEDRGSVVRGEKDTNVLVIEGRATDFVKIGGEGVLLSKLEELLERLKLEFGYAGDAAILAAEDERLGAVIVLIANTTTETNRLVSEFNARVLPFERVRRTEIVDALPRSALGKLLREAALRLVGLKPLAHD